MLKCPIYGITGQMDANFAIMHVFTARGSNNDYKVNTATSSDITAWRRLIPDFSVRTKI